MFLFLQGIMAKSRRYPANVSNMIKTKTTPAGCCKGTWREKPGGRQAPILHN